jgi:cytoskeletal protein CcmA (bactofilin family)
MNNKSKGVTYIGADMSLKGEIDIQGPALIAGKITGVVRSSDEVKIEPGGVIDGEVYCQELRVSGTLKGKLFCNKLVIISTGVVEADVSSHDMEIYDGGQFIGMRTKGPDADLLPTSVNPTPCRAFNQAGSADNVQVPKHAQKASTSSPVTEDGKPSGSSYKTILGVVSIAVIALLVWQSGALRQFSSPVKISAEPALFTQPSQSVESVTERNAAKLLNDVQAETFLVEQQEELINAGLADTDVAMEDLQAMEASNKLMTDIIATPPNDPTNVSDQVKDGAKKASATEPPTDKVAAKVNAINEAVSKTQAEKEAADTKVAKSGGSKG